MHGCQAVGNMKFKCNYCYRETVQLLEQRMGSLPERRVPEEECLAAVFRNTGVDFFGPMLVKERRSEVKVYGCLFTCMSTRACHLELVDDLSTDHFIMAFKRFIVRRGRPQSIHSDNGTERTLPSYEDAEVSDQEINSTKMWRQSQVLTNFFWRRFTKEYLPSLTERKKWKEKKQSLKDGDVWLVAEPSQQRGVWPLGRIVSTHPGQDGFEQLQCVLSTESTTDQL